MISTPILVLGAGPTGLMLSAQLHRYGAPHVIVDRKDGVTALSKALAVQARTLEQYRQLGLADAALAGGFVARSVQFVVDGRTRAKVRFGDIGAGLSPYPYVLIFEQSRNEALLSDHITAQGGAVRWATEVTDLRRDGDGFAGTLQRRDGTSEPFACRYLAGCGGASSPVRHFLDMPFRGGTNEQLFFVADVTLAMDIDQEGLLLVASATDFLAFFPMSGPGQYRVIGILPASVANPDDVPFDLLKAHIETKIGIPARITGHGWHAGYRVHHRIVDSFRAGDAFLVGDAAHIHSPAGGQGMNTGLGDAVNLGWKLAAVVNHWAAPALLDSYNAERRPFGVQLVKTTDRVFAMMTAPDWFPRMVRTRILPAALATALRLNPLRRKMFRTISQTRISYRGGPLADGTGTRRLKSGDRFPWFAWEGGDSFGWLTEPGHVVLQFGGAEAVPVAGWRGPVREIAVTGAAAAAAVAAGLPRQGCAVVRPDMHVATIVGE